MATDRQRSSKWTDWPILGGSVGGAVAYILGYVVTGLVKSNQVQNEYGEILGQFAEFEGLPAAWQVAGWIYYAAHNVEVVLDATITGQSISRAVPITEGALWEAWFPVVPLIALLIAGYVVAYRSDAPSVTEGFTAGASVVLGYGLLAIAGAFLFAWSLSVEELGAEVTVAVGPDLAWAVLLSGLAYPIVLGGIGGAIASQT
ncbi:MAG: hypothetical protein ACOCQY_02155 [Halorhabdus sp.]